MIKINVKISKDFVLYTKGKNSVLYTKGKNFASYAKGKNFVYIQRERTLQNYDQQADDALSYVQSLK